MQKLSNKSKYESLVKNGIQSAKLGKFKESENYFIKAINQNKNKPDAYINLANVLILQKRNTKSFKILLNYINSNTSNYKVSNFAAKIFLNFNVQNEFTKLCKILNIKKNKHHKASLIKAAPVLKIPVQLNAPPALTRATCFLGLFLCR